jgi:hypothetical protein
LIHCEDEMSDKDVDQQMSRIQRLTRNRDLRLLWFMLLLLIAAFQVMMFLRLRASGPFFHSTRGAILVAALVGVTLLGVVVRSRENRPK